MNGHQKNENGNPNVGLGQEMTPVQTIQPQTAMVSSPVPVGLEYLAGLVHIKIHQVLHLGEVLTGFEMNNQYRICNAEEQQFLHAKEDTDCFTRQVLKNLRPFDMLISDMQGRSVLELTRGMHCQGCCCPCCLQQMEVQYPPGNTVATVKEVWSFVTPRYVVEDTNNEVIFRIEGDCCWCAWCVDVSFKVFLADGSEVAKITKHWGGFRELMGQVNDFSISFDPAANLQPLSKAILLGATFHVDMMYFEHK